MSFFKWDIEKNKYLKKNRNITFEEVVDRIAAGAKVDEYKHPNEERYPNQQIMVVEIERYCYLVPYVKKDEEIFLKTIIPSRKATKEYLKGNK